MSHSTLRISTTLYHIYQILYCKGHIQMTIASNHNTIDVKKETNTE